MTISFGRKNAALSFPNQSRSYDEKRSRVCFWGYDSIIEVSFFVDTSILEALFPQMVNAETGILQAFDTAREQIQNAAQKLYLTSRDGSHSFNLAAKDF
jgi:hypothetical protein